MTMGPGLNSKFSTVVRHGGDLICHKYCKRDLQVDAANLRPALEQPEGCGRQTLSARKLFSQANLLYVPDFKM